MGPTDETRGADTTYYRRRQRPSTFALTVRTAALAGAAALVLAVGLAWQMARGADPALGGGGEAAAPQPKKIVKTLVVRRVQTAPSTSSISSAGGSSVTAAPVAPAPAPVTTSTS